MLACKSFNTALNTVVAENGDLLGTSDALTIVLLAADFTPTPSLTFADIVPAGFPGSTPKVVVTGSQTQVFDTVSGLWGVLLKEPAGGFNFVCTSAPGEPETIYGFALVSAGTDLWGIEKLAAPVVIGVPGNNVLCSALFGYQATNTYDDLPTPAV